MAKPKKQDLGSFDGAPVLATSIRITNAGDGLSKALAVDPQIIHPDEKIYVVLETTCAQITFKPVKDTDGMLRLHTLSAGAATIVDKNLVADVLAKQVIRLEEAAGLLRLPMDKGEGDPADTEGGE